MMSNAQDRDRLCHQVNPTDFRTIQVLQRWKLKSVVAAEVQTGERMKLKIDPSYEATGSDPSKLEKFLAYMVPSADEVDSRN